MTRQLTDIPLDAGVQCSDGECGTTMSLVVNPVSRTVTHVAIHDEKLPNSATRLVPSQEVVSVTKDQITLKCTREDVAGMHPFLVDNLVQQSPSGWANRPGTAYSARYVFNDTAYTSVQEQDIPKGELSLVSGMHVETRDGKKGKLTELVLDPNSGQITHLLVREGHLWNKKDLAIPVDDVDLFDGDTIYLKLDERAVRELPDIPVKHP